MDIQTAVLVAMEERKLMVRESVYEEFGHTTAIRPTNSYDCCQLVKIDSNHIKEAYRYWNPTASDLMANDWIVIDIGERKWEENEQFRWSA